MFLNGGAPQPKIVGNRPFFFRMIIVAYLGHGMPRDFSYYGSSSILFQNRVFVGEVLTPLQLETRFGDTFT